MTPTKMFSVLAIIAAVGCGGDGDNDDDLPTEARYVVTNEIYVGSASTTYVNVLPSLDNVQIDLTKATVFEGGRATLLTYNGFVFVAPPDRPVITKYSIDSKGALVEEGEVSFANYGLSAIYIDDWGLSFISPTKAYLLHRNTGGYIVFDPTTMRITGEVQPRMAMTRNTPAGQPMTLSTSGMIVRGNRVFQTFSWYFWDDFLFSTEQYLSVTDTDSDTQISLVSENRCPPFGNRVDKDESGTLYFSNWIWVVGATLVKDAPPACALRILPNAEQFDPSWVLDYHTITEGREAAMFDYLGNGKGTLNVFHGERTTWDSNTDGATLAASNNWKVWNVDLAAGTGAPMEGQDWMSGGASTFTVDGRSYILTPSLLDTTTVSEIKDGRSTPSFEVPGWCYQLMKVR